MKRYLRSILTNTNDGAFSLKFYQRRPPGYPVYYRVTFLPPVSRDKHTWIFAQETPPPNRSMA